MNFLFLPSFLVLAQENTKAVPKSFLESIPLVPLSLLFLFILIGSLFYFFYSRRKKKEKPPLSNLMTSQIKSNPPPNIAVTLSPKPLEKAEIQSMGIKTQSSLPPIVPKSPLAKAYSYTPPKQNLLNPEKPPFYKTTKFLAGLFLLLLVAIPTLIYFGVKRQQSLTGRAEGCDRNCGAASSNSQCWSWAGAGCGWSGDPYSGSCDCTRTDAPSATPVPPGSDDEICCSGSGDCPSGQQCKSGSEKCAADNGKGVCRAQSAPLGCCDGPQDCAPWERCVDGNGACPSNKSCRSTSGCTRDTDCIPPNTCINGTCSGGSNSGTLECHADKGGVSIINNTGGSITCSGTYASCQSPRGSQAECESNNACQGASHDTGSFTLANGESKTFGSISPNCESWQSDVAITCGTYTCSNVNNGCEWGDNCGGPTTTPTTPPSGQCRDVRVYDSSGVRIYDYTSIRPGQTVRFTTVGTSTGFDKARFRINNGAWLPSSEGTSQTTGNNEFYLDYPIPNDATTVKVESMVHHPTFGWK